ncbi:MAG TPA: hypothetical protein VJ438_01835 [Candidatus Nanoarchaeia archaeon]|nr:hypothetical protein [Candidatus Nanoarchaeia archaeon]
MSYVFEITDKSGRKIHLSKKQWAHIRKKHPEIEDFEMLKEGIEKFDKVTNYGYDPSVHYFYKHFKHKQPPNRHLCIAIKYLNGEGYIITAYFDKNIK